MKIDKIKATNMDLTEAIRDHVIDKLSGLESKLRRFGEAVTVEVEVGKTSHHHNKGDVFRCEINISLPGKKFVRAEEVQEDLYAAVVEAKRKADRQISEIKDQFTAN